MKHTVVLSDVHLCEAVPGEGLWMRYRQRRFFPDGELARLFERLRHEARNDELTVVFNGDLFDFDAPPVMEGKVVFTDAPHSETLAIDILSKILADHHVLVDALARLLIEGHRVVFVSGNHDAQLSWPRVRETLTRCIGDAAVAISGEESRSSVESRVVHRAWFFSENGVHVEHGNQYDHFCSFRYPTEPFTDDGDLIQPTMGSLSYRRLVSRMGYFNPHVDSSFMLSLPDYVSHWAKYYLRSEHSLAAAWINGAVKIMGDIVKSAAEHVPQRAARDLERAAEETGTQPHVLSAHAALFAAPSAAFPALRELWLDRAAAMGAVGAAAIVGGLLGGIAGSAKLTAGAAGALATYELLIPKPTLQQTYAKVMERSRDVARMYGARAVVFGHTHSPHGIWDANVFFGNSGTWSAAFHDIECTIPKDLGKPVIWLRDRGRGRLDGGLYLWQSDELIPQNVPEGSNDLVVPTGAIETVDALVLPQIA